VGGLSTEFRMHIPLDIPTILGKNYKLRSHNVGLTANPSVTPQKHTQDLVAGNPKSVIRQQMGGKAAPCPHAHQEGRCCADPE
jgi:hypothetical protein